MTDALLKLEGAGNDFVLGFGDWAVRLAADAGLVVRLCDRRRGIGADGVLAVERRGDDRIRLLHRNADGGRPGFCANGTRCAAAAARRLLGVRPELVVETDRGEIAARVASGEVTLTLAAVAPPRPLEVTVEDRPAPAWLLEVGVPHLVVAVDRVEAVDLATEGPRLRALPLAGPEGSNVHLSGRRGDELEVRSFERGVEGETWCCGSGVVAAALLEMAASGRHRVVVRPRSGDRLTVAVPRGPFDGPVEATGPVRFVGRLQPFPEWLESQP